MLTTILTWLDVVFGGDVPREPLGLGQIAARAIVVYLAGLVVIRIGKSRLLSRATPLDVILAFLLGSLLSRAITGSASLSGTVVASAVLVAVHWVLSRLTVDSHWLGNLIKGNAYPIVENGEIVRAGLRRAHLSEHDLLEHLRTAHVDDLRQVKAAYKERSGEIGIVLRRADPKVVEISVAHGVQTVRIELT